MEEFKFIYGLIVSFAYFIGVFVLLSHEIKGKISNKINMVMIALFLVSLMILFGMRTEDIGTDTYMYIFQYENSFRWGEIDEREPLYPFVINGMRLISEKSSFFLYIMATIYLFFMGAFIKKMNIKKENRINVYLFFLLLISLPSFLSMGINIIRQGVSIAILLNALLAFRRKKYRWTFLFCFLSIVFHSTSLLPILLYLCAYLLKNLKVSLALYVVSIIVAFFGLGIIDIIELVPFISSYDPRFGAYFKGDAYDYVIEFKPQFVAFNTAFLLIGLYIYRRNKMNSKNDTTLLNYFCLSSCLFFLAFQLPYSDRWGIFSWTVMPILLIDFMSSNSKKGYPSLVYIYSFIIFIFFNFIL